MGRYKRHYATVEESVFLCSHVTETALRLYLLLERFWQKSDCCWPSGEALGKLLGCRPEAISRAVTTLRELGLIEVTRRGLGYTNVYQFVADWRCPQGCKSSIADLKIDQFGVAPTHNSDFVDGATLNCEVAQIPHEVSSIKVSTSKVSSPFFEDSSASSQERRPEHRPGCICLVCHPEGTGKPPPKERKAAPRFRSTAQAGPVFRPRNKIPSWLLELQGIYHRYTGGNFTRAEDAETLLSPIRDAVGYNELCHRLTYYLETTSLRWVSLRAFAEKPNAWIAPTGWQPKGKFTGPVPDESAAERRTRERRERDAKLLAKWKAEEDAKARAG
jgi:biotin operon repressor